MFEEIDWFKLKISILKLNLEWRVVVFENKLMLLECFCDIRKKMESIFEKMFWEVFLENGL